MMKGLEQMCAETFLENQGKLFDIPVAETTEEALEFLTDCYASVFDNIAEIRKYWDEDGMDVTSMTDEDIEDALEVFKLPNGKYLLVEA